VYTYTSSWIPTSYKNECEDEGQPHPHRDGFALCCGDHQDKLTSGTFHVDGQLTWVSNCTESSMLSKLNEAFHLCMHTTKAGSKVIDSELEPREGSCNHATSMSYIVNCM
jgi:hypothetical protein